jgi:hypothetical protein
MSKAGIAYEEKPLDATVMARCLCETDEWVQSAPLVLDGAVWIFYDDLFIGEKLLPDWRKILEGIKPQIKQFGGMGGNPSKKEQICKSIWKEDEMLK